MLAHNLTSTGLVNHYKRFFYNYVPNVKKIFKLNYQQQKVQNN
jgi:hypothetical protein